MSYVYIVQIYAVGSSSNNGIYALDFHPDTSSACHVDYKYAGLSFPVCFGFDGVNLLGNLIFYHLHS